MPTRFLSLQIALRFTSDAIWQAIIFKDLEFWLSEIESLSEIIARLNEQIEDSNRISLTEQLSATYKGYITELQAFRNADKKSISKEENACKRLKENFNALIKKAERDAHTLKSTSGTIEATQVQYLAEKLENACQEHDLRAETIVAELLVILKPMLESLQSFYDRAEEVILNPPSSETDIVQIQQYADQLKELIEGYETKAISVAEKLDKLLASTAAAEEAKKVVTAINGYDFDSAQLRFAELDKKLSLLYR